MKFDITTTQWRPLLGQIWRAGPHVELIDYATSPWVKAGDGIFISGFWRSGTTWVQQMVADMLEAKSVFEPLDPRVWNSRNNWSGPSTQSSSAMWTHTYMPFADGEFFYDQGLQAYLSRALQAKLPGRWVRRARRGPLDAFRKRVVVKLVRGQLCLNAISATFQVPIVHVSRDPRAVVASVMRAGWGNGWLSDVDLSDNLLNQDDGRYEYFSRWEDEIRSSESLDTVSRVAIFWALTEKFVVDKSLSTLSELVLVSYEDLSANPHRYLADRLDQAGVDLKWQDGTVVARSAAKSSPTSGSRRAHQSMVEKMNSWKTELTKSEIAKIEAIADRFDLSDRLVG